MPLLRAIAATLLLMVLANAARGRQAPQTE